MAKHFYIYMRGQFATTLFVQFQEQSGNLVKISEGGLHVYDLVYNDGSNTYIFPNGFRFVISGVSRRPRCVIYDDNNNVLSDQTYGDQAGGSYIKDLYLSICRETDQYGDYLKWMWWRKADNGSWYMVDNAGYLSLPQYADLLQYFGDTYDPYGTDDDQTPPGGYGNFDYTSEIETPPSLPSISAAQVGFVSLWNLTTQEMKDLASYLWTGTFDLTNFKKLFTDPMECVLSVGIIPITPTTEVNKREIVFGGSSHSGVNAYPVTEQFYIVDMGSVRISGQSNSAMDYSPYAKASIYLPYCGTYALDIDEIMDSTLSLEYHIDIYTGACVAYLTIDGHTNSDGHNVNAIMYQFTGNILASIPITGNDHSQFIQSMLFMGASIAATVASSGAGAPAIEGAAASGDVAGAGMALNAATAGSAINTVMSMKPNVLHSGNLSSTAGLLGGQKPFITMHWSNLCRPEDEYKLAGMPLHKSGTLSDFEGFTVVSACHMDNILCTDAERSMIEQALAKGVII